MPIKFAAKFFSKLTPSPLERSGVRPIFKKMGFYSDQEGIMRRYQREKLFWDEHLEKTKSFILKSASGKKNGKCAVLGS